MFLMEFYKRVTERREKLKIEEPKGKKGRMMTRKVVVVSTEQFVSECSAEKLAAA